MHILLTIIGLLSGLGILLWRISIAAQAAHELGEAAEGLFNLPRKLGFQSKSRRHPLGLIEDPKEAATLLLYGFITLSGRHEDRQAELLSRLQSLFEIDREHAIELYQRAKWHVSHLNDEQTIARKLSPSLYKQVGLDAYQGLFTLLTDLHPGPYTPGEQTYLDQMGRVITR
ncbi:hypothetical protein [Woodsholea maritima]|uniref:hypothetical protein n=1 Tax=Woodsholea maritima TaxID=240237 RepID=UPI0003758A59|nr:hypothetical protein [Woodsholea maritima]